MFDDKYRIKVKGDNYNLSIHWNRVKEDGYCGLALEFCKIRSLCTDQNSIEKYCSSVHWTDSFDVESLCVWDIDGAFDNKVFLIRLKISK